MRGYFASKRQRWPADEAREILQQVRLGPDHRWMDRTLAAQAAETLARAAFPVDDLAESYLKIAINYESLRHLDNSEGCQVLGCAYPSSREIVVSDRTLKYHPLFRTTVLHETGHVLMHRRTAKRCLLYKPERLASTPEEREANAFMQAAILPESVLDLAICHICNIYGIDLRLAYSAANGARGRWVWRHRLFVHLINALCVSREMMGIKLKQLWRFSDETVEYHKTYALRTWWHTPETLEVLPRPLRKVMRSVYERLVAAELSTDVAPSATEEEEPMMRSHVVTRLPQLRHHR